MRAVISEAVRIGCNRVRQYSNHVIARSSQTTEATPNPYNYRRQITTADISYHQPSTATKPLFSLIKYIWAQIRILHETEKAILVDNGMKIWIPKSRIRRIRLRKNTFEIYVKESTVG